MHDLKAVYAVVNLESVQQAMQHLEEKWSLRFPYVIKSWYNNWDNLTTYYHFPPEIRRLMYTTNIIES
jgi:transposase-like protein